MQAILNRTPIPRPRNFAERFDETVLALSNLANVGLKQMFPSPAALQLYLLNDQSALNDLIAESSQRITHSYVDNPLASLNNMSRMQQALDNASVWLTDRLDTEVYEAKFGMRAERPLTYRMLMLAAAYSLRALVPDVLNQETMAAVNGYWDTWADIETRRTVSRVEKELQSFQATYRRALRGSNTERIKQLQIRGNALALEFRVQIYDDLFKKALEAIRREDARLTVPRPTLQRQPEPTPRSPLPRQFVRPAPVRRPTGVPSARVERSEPLPKPEPEQEPEPSVEPDDDISATVPMSPTPQALRADNIFGEDLSEEQLAALTIRPKIERQ